MATAHGMFFSTDLNAARLWEDVEDYWPRRLLHIPTMTSYQRSGSSTYNHLEHPKYSILSYTWGRWEVRQVDGREPKPASLGVKGTTWKVPSVDEAHFTVQTFQKVVNEMGRHGRTEWAWIDIACIDQENTPVKMDEVGRQASIFKNAWKAFVWLSHTTAGALDNAVALMETAGAALLEARRGAGPTNTYQAEGILPTLGAIREAIDPVLDDPWFSSLWTLQELFLRDDALILDRKGDCIRLSVPTIPEDPFLAVYALQYELHTMKVEMQELEQRFQPKGPAESLEIYRIANAIKSRILSSGFGADGQFTPNNPNVQYSAAKFRQTVHREDRVYAISQIYNIRVGQTLRPKEPPLELESLVEEFALAINARSPLLGQLFVHTAQPPRGRGWCITQESDVPDAVQLLDDAQVTSTIARTAAGLVVAEGLCCDFDDIRNASIRAGTHAAFHVHLDRHVRQLLDPEGALPSDPVFASLSEGLWECLSGYFGGDSLRVLLLGTSKGAYAGEMGTLGSKLTPREYYGILIRKVDRYQDAGDDACYERLGICHWTALKAPEWGTDNITELLGRIAVESGSAQPEGIPYQALWETCNTYAQDVAKLFSTTMTVTLI